MKRILLLLAAICFIGVIFSTIEPPRTVKEKKTICLNMIVKNESEVIRRCLESVKSHIDYWVIVDTGSTDGTQKIIKTFMKDVPGELHERPWLNFAHNRNEALELTKGKSDYVLFIDADELFIFDKDFEWPDLDKDFYYIPTDFSGMKYQRVLLVDRQLDWKWQGVLHEFIDTPQAKTSGTLEGVVNFVTTEGFRSKDPLKFQKDAEILEAALKEDPQNKRNVFYLAQSYRDAGNDDQAIVNYFKRISMGGWDQEIFWSLLQIGRLKEKLNRPANELIAYYRLANQYRPSRAEPLYQLANYHRRNGNYLASYLYAHQGLKLPLSPDILFVEKWMYDFGLWMEFSISAYWIGEYMESYLASQVLLSIPSLPPEYRQAVENNLVWINEKLNK